MIPCLRPHSFISALPSIYGYHVVVRGEGICVPSTHTREFEWLQVSDVEDDGEKIGVESYALKNLTKDLQVHVHVPLHPIPPALNGSI